MINMQMSLKIFRCVHYICFEGAYLCSSDRSHANVISTAYMFGLGFTEVIPHQPG